MMTASSSKGIMGIGALIIVTAILLVSAVTGIILLTSGGSLQQKSIRKGQEGKQNVVSGMEAVSVIGTGADVSSPTPHVVDDIHIMVRLLPGTITTPFNNTLIYVETGRYSQTTLYNTSCASECNAATSSFYNVYYLKEGTYYEAGYLNLGDVAKIAVKVGGGIREDESVKILIIPANGPKTVIKLETPNTLVARSITLWPTS